jgi:hypothetical protein
MSEKTITIPEAAVTETIEAATAHLRPRWQTGNHFTETESRLLEAIKVLSTARSAAELDASLRATPSQPARIIHLGHRGEGPR